MTTTEANQNASRLAAVRTLVSGAEWTRVAFIDASAHTMASSPTLVPNKGIVVPRGPGLGLEWDEKAAYEYALE
jgi:L-alanine-DL-glutamate epimerase-like enolase superfamily enzyme